ncbi:MAG: sigma 54-interacting transcriptional regulator [Desulfobacterales bacterium]
MTDESTSEGRILAIDDEPVIRENIATYLEDSGFTVLQAANGLKGLEIARVSQPDVILLDLRMPEMDGLEFLDRVARECPGTPVIVVSGTGVLQDAIEALRSGARDFITKPILDMAVLEHAVRKAMEHSRLLLENRRYREHLESEIAARTADLIDRTRALEESNLALKIEIQQRLEAEKALIRREQKFRELADLLPQAVFEADPQGRFSFVNRYGLEILGVKNPGDDSKGTFDNLLIPQERARIRFEIARLLEGERPGNFDTIIRKRDGTTFPAMVYVSPVLKAGAVDGLRGIIFDITELRKAEAALRASAEKLEQENLQLKSSLRAAGRFGRLVGRSRAMQEVYDRILKAAASSANVILYGESGTGKELVAQTIHELSDRRGEKLITVHCGAVPDHLMESEFFGYRKGAFTGATTDKPGYLSEAHRGTLFLDEIGEIPLSLQVKLLRAIEGGGFTPIGSSSLIKPDIRIIAATNRDLADEVRKGTLREDFFYRIHIIPIHMPPLRRRREDLPLLINHFLNELSEGKTTPSMPDPVVASLLERDWPGNVRELQNAVQRFITLNALEPSDAPSAESLMKEIPHLSPPPPGIRLAGVVAHYESQYIRRLLDENRWHRSRVARILGIDRRTLFRKIREYGLE